MWTPIIAAIAAVSLQAQEPIVISWSDLIPADAAPGAEDDTPVDHDGAGPAKQVGSADPVMDFDQQTIRMPGFMLPLDYSDKGEVTSFLLVPYYGACIHVPPPPPNQIVYVDTKAAPVQAKGLWDPVWVIGTMQVKMNKNGLGDAAYTLLLDEMMPYDD
ncbi:DUF3299 domain-containing protein [Parvularcula sp. LCG005]|uniref:DUF3299 domain-containing protein n=1 Tax=Parvularcula sp. LCG005 TaxID=3078805 RepID=UPI0029435E1E|nr:DUF3299 domain-containing protein [Parvularcula sp. LCG005]WOI52343.1 DUF3299 domain-containing protein [Parvularcula sp. LCG005]